MILHNDNSLSRKLKVSKMKQIDLLIRTVGKFGLWLNATLSFAFLYLPIFILVIYSFNDSRFNAVWRGFTL